MNADRSQGAPFAIDAAAPPGAYPAIRMRRNRRDGWTRRLVAENALSVDDLIWPIFVIEGGGEERPVASMPGQVRVTVDRLAQHVEKAATLGIPALAIFPVTPPEAKDAEGSEALNPDNLMCRAARELKRHYPEIGLVDPAARRPRHPDRTVPDDGLGAAGDRSLRGHRVGLHAPERCTAARRGERVLGHGRLHRARRHPRAAAELARVGPQLRRDVPRHDVRAGSIGCLVGDVEAHHARGGREHGEHQRQGQQLLAGGDEADLAEGHEEAAPVRGKFTRDSNFHTRHRRRGRVRE